MTEILCKREQRTVASQLTFSFERKRIMLAEIEVTRGLVGRYVEAYAYADGRLDVRWKGHCLPYTVLVFIPSMMLVVVESDPPIKFPIWEFRTCFQIGNALDWIDSERYRQVSAGQFLE